MIPRSRLASTITLIPQQYRATPLQEDLVGDKMWEKLHASTLSQEVSCDTIDYEAVNEALKLGFQTGTIASENLKESEDISKQTAKRRKKRGVSGNTVDLIQL